MSQVTSSQAITIQWRFSVLEKPASRISAGDSYWKASAVTLVTDRGPLRTSAIAGQLRRRPGVPLDRLDEGLGREGLQEVVRRAAIAGAVPELLLVEGSQEHHRDGFRGRLVFQTAAHLE